jgi:hypothetical protein
VHGHASHVIAAQLDFSRVEPGTDIDSKGANGIANGTRALNGPDSDIVPIDDADWVQDLALCRRSARRAERQPVLGALKARA